MESQNHITYRRDECAVFLKTTEHFGGLPNRAGGYPLSSNGIRVLTSEALYQVCRFPHLPDVQKLIIGRASPMTAKMKSKPYRKDSRFHDRSSSEIERDLRLEVVGQDSSPWGDVSGGIVLVLVLFAQSVVGIARVRKERVLMDERAHQWTMFGLTLLEHTLTACANITSGMLLPSI